MTRDRITNQPGVSPSTSIRVEADKDVPPSRDPHHVQPRLSVGSVIGGIAGGGFLGLIAGGLLGWLFFRTNGPMAVIGLVLGAVLGCLAVISANRRKIGRGVRVVNRDLPHGARPAPARPSLTGAADPRIVTRRDALALFTSSPSRRVSRLVGHHGPITAVALSADGRLALSAGKDGMVSLWDVQTGFEVRSLQAFRAQTNAVAFSPDGRLVVAVGVHVRVNQAVQTQGGALVWDAESGQLLRQVEFEDNPWSLAFLPGGREVVIGTNEYLHVWELETPASTGLVHVGPGPFASAEVRAVAVMGDGRLVLAGCHHTQDMRLVNLDLGEEVRSFVGHSKGFPGFRRAGVVTVAFSPDGMKALSGSWDQTARVWNLLTSQELVCFKGHCRWWGWRGVVGVAWLDDERAVSASEDGRLCVWYAATGEELEQQHHGGGVTCLATTPGARLALTGGCDGSVRVWELG